ncbi:hypothetical protein VB005_10783 [Metarhizium brunneum]
MTGNDQDVFRKVGRGGAGNFYSVKDDKAAAAAAAADRDLERQDPVVTTVPDPATPGQPIRAGRGGAGNYIDPSQLPDADEKSRISKEVTAAVTSSLKKHPSRAMGGRGGAGNWTGEEHEKPHGEEGGNAAHELERKVKEAVEKGLKIPDKVHHGREKEIK